MSKPAANTLHGIGFAVLATACFATLDTTTKWVSLSAPLMVAMFFRYLFQALATTAAVLPRRGSALWQTHHLGLHVLRGLLLLITSLFGFLSLKHMPVGEFTAIILVTPLVVTLLAGVGHPVTFPQAWAQTAPIPFDLIGDQAPVSLASQLPAHDPTVGVVAGSGGVSGGSMA